MRDCDELYYTIYYDQVIRTTTTVTEHEHVATAAPLEPKSFDAVFVTPSYCSSTPGALTTKTATKTVTVKGAEVTTKPEDLSSEELMLEL